MSTQTMEVTTAGVDLELNTIYSDGSNDYYDGYYEYYEYDYGDEYMYPGYDFERALYLHLWEIVVVIISIVNIIVISVLLRKKMRNATNIILAAIAVSDSLTGLVTLPTYIMVYQRYDPNDTNYDYGWHNVTNYDLVGEGTTTAPFAAQDQGNISAYDSEQVDGYILTGNLCEAFMLSKYFFSKWFHTVSIFLTLFLAIQRYVSVAFPYKSHLLFNTKRTVISCMLIFLSSSLFHVYHINKEKAKGGMCQWELQERGCGGTCIYLWIAFCFRHFIPCVILIVFSVLFIARLRHGEQTLRRMDSNSSQMARRSVENRRISLLVTAIVVIFLVPEIPYSIFLLYNALDKAIHDGKGIDIRINRIIQLVYDIALVLSFHANVYIYVLFNKRFRRILYRTVVKPVQRFVGDTRRLSITRTSSSSHAGSSKKPMRTDSTKVSQDANRLHEINDPDKSSAYDSKTLQTLDSEKSKDALEMEPLNYKI